MKAYCISDNTDTLMGMRLAGFEGIVLHERQEILDKLNQLIADPNVAIVLMTTKAMEQVADVVARKEISITTPH